MSALVGGRAHFIPPGTVMDSVGKMPCVAINTLWTREREGIGGEEQGSERHLRGE